MIEFSRARPLFQQRSLLIAADYWACQIYCNEGSRPYLYSHVYALSEEEALQRASRTVDLLQEWADRNGGAP